MLTSSSWIHLVRADELFIGQGHYLIVIEVTKPNEKAANTGIRN